MPSTVTKVDRTILDQHAKTLAHLVSQKEGHLRPLHPLTHESGFKGKLDAIKQGIGSAADSIKTPGQLIYVEVELDKLGAITGVNSIGANYYYLWRCLDSVREVMTPTGPKQRPILVPREEEWPQDSDPNTTHSPPGKLTMGRSLLGYVSDARRPGTAGVGKGDFAQMAGRFGFNNAIEVLQDGECGNDNSRFLMPKFGCVVPLRVLGAPRPSAALEYVQQVPTGPGPAKPRTGYGETSQEPGGELNGYAFYAHQPDAATDATIYAFDSAADREDIKKDISSLARFVSQPGQVFRLRLRFSGVRPWELAALLASLRPGLLDQSGTHPFRSDPADLSPKHAVKLGRGRPLGMGSVRFDIDKVTTQDGRAIPDDSLRSSMVALKHLLTEAGLAGTLTEWLSVHQYDGLTRAAYPTATPPGNNPGPATILGHYSRKTAEFLRQRRAWP